MWVLQSPKQPYQVCILHLNFKIMKLRQSSSTSKLPTRNYKCDHLQSRVQSRHCALTWTDNTNSNVTHLWVSMSLNTFVCGQRPCGMMRSQCKLYNTMCNVEPSICQTLRDFSTVCMCLCVCCVCAFMCACMSVCMHVKERAVSIFGHLILLYHLSPR